MPRVAAPLGVFWGWNLRREGFAEGDLCGLSGSYIAPDEAAARYETVDAYVGAVGAAAAALAADGLMLAGDADLVAERAKVDYAAASSQ